MAPLIFEPRSHCGTLFGKVEKCIAMAPSYRNGSLALKFSLQRTIVQCNVEFIRKSAAHTIVLCNENLKAKEPLRYTFQLFQKLYRNGSLAQKSREPLRYTQLRGREPLRYTRAILVQPFFGGSADFEINFWHSKRKLMAFSCLIHFSSVPPQCVMLW